MDSYILTTYLLASNIIDKNQNKKTYQPKYICAISIVITKVKVIDHNPNDGATFLTI